MNINPNLTGAQNIIAQATDAAFTAPTDPNNLGVGIPLPYPVPSGQVIPGVNVDGGNSNTLVKVFIRPLLDDVPEDGANQTIIYERTHLSDVQSPNASMASGLGSQEALTAIAKGLGLVLDQIKFTNPYIPGQPSYSIQPVTNSLLYLSGTLVVSINYTS
jgi:hypothetical protein